MKTYVSTSWQFGVDGLKTWTDTYVSILYDIVKKSIENHDLYPNILTTSWIHTLNWELSLWIKYLHVRDLTPQTHSQV